MTTTLRDRIAKEATIVLSCEPETDRIEGNCSAIDPVTDRQTEKWIRDQLEAGNEWAWCMVRVRAFWKGLEANDYLGCCSYLGEADFRTPGGYFDDMVSNTIDELTRMAEEIRDE